MPMSDLNWGWIVGGGALVWNVVATLYAWYSASQSVTKKEIDALMAAHAETANRVTAIERDLRAMPSADNFHQLEIAVTEMRGGMKVLEAEFKPTALSVRRIEEFLLNTRKVTR